MFLIISQDSFGGGRRKFFVVNCGPKEKGGSGGFCTLDSLCISNGCARKCETTRDCIDDETACTDVFPPKNGAPALGGPYCVRNQHCKDGYKSSFFRIQAGSCDKYCDDISKFRGKCGQTYDENAGWTSRHRDLISRYTSGDRNRAPQ